MPYIDLSSPTNPAASITTANDMSTLPQSIVQQPTIAAPADTVQPQLQQQTQPQLPQLQAQQSAPTPMEDHELLKNVPADLNANPTSVSDGIKEFKGPSLEIKPTTLPQEPVQTKNTDSLLPEIPVVASAAPMVENKPATSVTVNDELDIETYIAEVIAKNASDLHIAVGFPPTIRIDGKLVPLGVKDLTAEDTKSMLEKMLSKKQKDDLLRNYDIDFSYSHKSGERFRINIFWSKGTLAGALRYIPSKIRSIAELGLPNICFDLIKRPHGLVLLTGPTGSGKSTSIAAMINEINMTDSRHIVTIEDPVEYIFPRAKSIVNQREIGSDVISWKRGLREILREDPNVVVVGEMRDFETIAATITVAETGHLVFATLHTNSASQTVDRIIDVFPDVQQPQIRAQLANVIAAVIAQRLIPLQNGGRKAVFEVMAAIPAVKNAIREGKTYQIDNIIQTNIDVGMITLERSLVQLIRNGEISVETAKEYTNKPDELDALLTQN